MILKKHYANLLVSSGTNNPFVLLPRFRKMVEIAQAEGCDCLEAARVSPVIMRAIRHQEINVEDLKEVKDYVFGTLIGVLNSIAPEGHGFGKHSNIALNYGFWPLDQLAGR